MKYSRIHILNMAAGVAIFFVALNFVTSVQKSIDVALSSVGSKITVVFDENFSRPTKMFEEQKFGFSKEFVEILRNKYSADYDVEPIMKKFHPVYNVEMGTDIVETLYTNENFQRVLDLPAIRFPSKYSHVCLAGLSFKNHLDDPKQNHQLVFEENRCTVKPMGADILIPPNIRSRNTIIFIRNPEFAFNGAASLYTHIFLRAKSQTQSEVPKDLESFVNSELENRSGISIWNTLSFWELKTKIANQLSFTLIAVSSLILFLSMVGISTGLNQKTFSRKREFGLRIAMGATKTNIFILVLKDGILVCSLGSILGVILGVLILNFVVAPLAFSITVNDDFIISTALDYSSVWICAIVLSFSAIFASLSPAWNAANTEPSLSIRGLS